MNITYKYKCNQYDEKIGTCAPNWIESNFNKKCPVSNILDKIDVCMDGIVSINWTEYIIFNKELNNEDLIKL